MRLFLTIIGLLLMPVVAMAEQATLNSPIAQASIHNYRVEDFHVVRNNGNPRWEVVLSQRDSGGNEVAPRLSFTGPGPSAPQSGATVTLLCTALDTIVSGEPTNDAQAANYRVLNYLITHGYLVGVTLAP